MTDQRTATEVLLSLEKKIDQQVHLYHSIDLNIKVLSNKLNQVIQLINTPMPDEQGFSMYGGTNAGTAMPDDLNPHKIATAPPSRMKIEDEWKPPIPITTETAPVGERRISRPPTPGMQAPKPSPKPLKSVPTPSFPVPEMKAPTSITPPPIHTGKVPLSQRIVDRNGNSIFKADVEVQNNEGTTIWKGQTNTTGKWQASLDPGNYHVQVRKQSANQRLQVAQDLVVNDKTPRELPIMVVK
jgi:hypothetical protein